MFLRKFGRKTFVLRKFGRKNILAKICWKVFVGENLVKVFKNKNIVKLIKSKDSNIIELQKSLENKIGLSVIIQNKKNNSGKITFEYKNLDQLDKIIDTIKNNY